MDDKIIKEVLKEISESILILEEKITPEHFKYPIELALQKQRQSFVKEISRRLEFAKDERIRIRKEYFPLKITPRLDVVIEALEELLTSINNKPKEKRWLNETIWRKF